LTLTSTSGALQQTSGGVVRYGAFPVFALGSTLMLEQGERLSLAQAFDGIRADFGVSDTALGALAAAMVLVGVIGGIPIGALADRARRATLLAVAMLIWTVCMGLGAIAPGFIFLFIGRLGVGAVEANGPAAFSLMSDYYPVAIRARMMGRYQLGSAVGGMFGVGLSGLLVDTYGWRAAFWMWIPVGLIVVAVLTRLPEPERGGQDRAFHLEAAARIEADGLPGLLPDLGLPTPRRSELQYDTASWMDVLRELRHIRSMWFALMSLTISSFLLGALGVWGIEFFKQAFDLSATKAGAFVPLIGGGAIIGLVGGGELADRLLRRGVTNARVYVTAVASVLASVLLLPAFLTSSLPVAAVLLFLGSTCLTVPVAPSEALMSDVVPGALRGRAAAIRSVVRALSALAPLIVGFLSDLTDLPTALAMVTPMYAVGGLVMLLAARTYAADLAFVAADARRTMEGSVSD
ncbi:MAG: MFS transporter, partial [Acidimicrobiales bacterium]